MRNKERRKIRQKERRQKKDHWRTCVRNITLLTTRLYVIFVALFVYSLPFPKGRTCWMARYIILVWVAFCVMISWVNGPKCENLLQFNTSWLESPRTWYYFKLCFSFSCSSYDLTLIKKSHTRGHKKNQNLTNSLLVTVVPQFRAKTRNSEKDIYFLSRISCSMNKLKSHVLFTCQNFVFRFYVEIMRSCITRM